MSDDNADDDRTEKSEALFQWLDSTWANAGYGKTSDPAAQTKAGLAYIVARYGRPIDQSFWRSRRWYD